jgi:hypothetical protein
LLTVSASAASTSASASATVHCHLSPLLVLHHRKRNRPKLFRSFRRSFL